MLVTHGLGHVFMMSMFAMVWLIYMGDLVYYMLCAKF
jgi:hypothetical protein